MTARAARGSLSLPLRPRPHLLAISPGDHGVERDLRFVARGLKGLDAVALLIREPHLDERELVRLVTDLGPLFPGALWVHARNTCGEDVARWGEHGLHLDSRADVKEVRARFDGPLGVSVHGLPAARRAKSAGADQLLLSPLFTPLSKPGDTRPTLGVERAADVQRKVKLPVFGLGGITPERARQCRDGGLAGVATIGALFPDDALPEEVRAAASALLAAWA